MSEHTPTPWVPMLNFQIAAQTREIACFASHHLFAPESKANRDFALRACNSHNDLLVALKEIANGPWTIDSMREIAGHAIKQAEETS